MYKTKDMGRAKRMQLGITREFLESTQFKNNLTPMADKVSGQRLQIVQSQFESMVIPVSAEMPKCQSAMIQDILTHSSSIQSLKGDVTLLKVFKFQDLTYYIYKHNGLVDVHIDEKYTESNGFAARTRTDFKDLELGETYDLDKSTPFYKTYIDQFDPITETVGYGANVRCIISTDLNNVQDSVGVSRRFAKRFTTLKPKCVNIHLAKKKIISKYPNIFPKLGEFIDNPLLFKIVKDDNTASSLAQDPLSPVGYEDDSINLEPLTYISRIEVFCNQNINDPILNQYRNDLLDFRQGVYEFVESLNEPISDLLSIIKNNFKHAKYRDRNIDLKDPLIKIYTKTISMTDTECKFTNLNGGKVTIAYIFDDGKYTDENGDPIDVIYPANSLVNRTISGALYEMHMNSIGLFAERAVREGTITPERLHEALTKIYKILGKTKEWKHANMSPEDMFYYLEREPMAWQLMPYEEATTIPILSEVTYVAEEYFGWRPLKVYNRGVEVSEPHVVGEMFVMRLMHDRFHIVAGSSIPKKDSRGHLVDKSPEKKDGRSIHSTKPTKLSILAIHKILNNLSNETAHIVFKEKHRLHSTHELINSVGFKLGTTKVVRNRIDVTNEEDESED